MKTGKTVVAGILMLGVVEAEGNEAWVSFETELGPAAAVQDTRKGFFTLAVIFDPDRQCSPILTLVQDWRKIRGVDFEDGLSREDTRITFWVDARRDEGWLITHPKVFTRNNIQFILMRDLDWDATWQIHQGNRLHMLYRLRNEYHVEFTLKGSARALEVAAGRCVENGD